MPTFAQVRLSTWSVGLCKDLIQLLRRLFFFFLHIGPLTAVGFRLRADGRKRLCPLRQETRRLAWKRKQERLSSIHALGFFSSESRFASRWTVNYHFSSNFCERKKHDHSHNVVVGTKSLELIFSVFFHWQCWRTKQILSSLHIVHATTITTQQRVKRSRSTGQGQWSAHFEIQRLIQCVPGCNAACKSKSVKATLFYFSRKLALAFKARTENICCRENQPRGFCWSVGNRRGVSSTFSTLICFCSLTKTGAFLGKSSRFSGHSHFF